MEYTLLKGTFRPDVGRPDGDSVHFMPENPTLLGRIPRRNRRRAPEVNNEGTLNIRYEGIDTLETNYRGPNQGQFARKATDKNIEILKAAQNDGIQGYILARVIDPNKRPIVFAFVGNIEESDGTHMGLDVEQMKDSVNFQMIQSGLAYPCFYSTLPDDLRAAISAAASEAEENDLGFWLHDRTQKGVEWEGPDSISNLQPIFPKLWRRLADYRRDRYFRDEAETLDAFIDYLGLQEEKGSHSFRIVIHYHRPDSYR